MNYIRNIRETIKTFTKANLLIQHIISGKISTKKCDEFLIEQELNEMANHIKSKSKKYFSTQAQQTSEVAGILDKTTVLNPDP